MPAAEALDARRVQSELGEAGRMRPPWSCLDQKSGPMIAWRSFLRLGDQLRARRAEKADPHGAAERERRSSRAISTPAWRHATAGWPQVTLETPEMIAGRSRGARSRRA
jgi:hypothetical protein